MIASSQMLNALAWSLLHFLWQGAAIAALAGVWMLVLKRPATRYLLGVGALALMLVCFGATFAALSADSTIASVNSSARAPAAVLSPLDFRATLPVIPRESQAATASHDVFAWIAWAWLAGVACFALRIVFGLLVLEHLRRRSLTELPAQLRSRLGELQERLGIRRAIRYAQCELVNVPAVIGFFRPIVLLPMRAMTGLTEDQLEAVIAHELGHVKRFDVVVNFAQVVAETLLFFHPAVWWLNKRIRADREDCCDDVAVAACGSKVTYARALAVMEDWRATPHFAMAATGSSSVAARVARLLGVNRRGEGRTAGAVAASLVLSAALLFGAAALGFSPAAWAQGVRASLQDDAWTPGDIEDAAIPADAAALATQAALASGEQVARAVTPAGEATEDVPAPIAAPKPVAPTPALPAMRTPPVPVIAAAQAAVPAPPVPAAPQPKAPKPPKPAMPAKAKVDAHVNARVNVNANVNVTADVDSVEKSYIDELATVDMKDLDVDTIIELKQQDVSAEYIRGLRAAGLDPDAHALVAMRTQDITPEYARGIRALGLKADEYSLIAMKVQDVTPEYVKAMRDAGVTGAADDFIAMKTQGITPEYLRDMRAAGYTLNTPQAIAFKVQDVTPDLAKAFNAAGMKLNVDQLIEARVFDISPEYLARVREHGFKDLTFEKLVALKNADVL